MNDWKLSLDRYLTQEPSDASLDNWAYEAIEKLDDDFFETNENWIMQSQGQCNDWLCKLYKNNKSPSEAAAIIQRAFRRYRE